MSSEGAPRAKEMGDVAGTGDTVSVEPPATRLGAAWASGSVPSIGAAVSQVLLTPAPRRRFARPAGPIAIERLADCVRELDPATRALLDLSIRRRARDDAMAPLLRTDAFHLAWMRARALERVAATLGDGDVPLADVRAALVRLPDDAWGVPGTAGDAKAEPVAADPGAAEPAAPMPAAAEPPTVLPAPRPAAAPVPPRIPHARPVDPPPSGAPVSLHGDTLEVRLPESVKVRGDRLEVRLPAEVTARGNRLQVRLPARLARGIHRGRDLAGALPSDPDRRSTVRGAVLGAALAFFLRRRR